MEFMKSMVRSKDQTSRKNEIPLNEKKAAEKKRKQIIKTVNKNKLKKLQDRIKKLEKEKAELYEKYLRLAAESDNSKKLMLKEAENRIRYTRENIIVDILPVLDDLERTIEAVPKKEKSGTLISGVEMIRDNLNQIFKRYGLETIESLGKEFDVEIHEALMTVKNEDYLSDYIVQEHQKGYKLNGHVIRHAKVAVNKIEEAN